MKPKIPSMIQFGNSPTYKVGTMLGEGGFGKVFIGHKMEGPYDSIIPGPDEVALKFEKAYDKGKKCQPPLEWNVYDQLGDCEGIPCIYYKGCYGQFYVMIMDLLGPSLDNTGDLRRPLLQQSDVNSIAMQALSILETLHKKGFVHCDIKPGNILFGRAGSVNDKKIYIADLGLAMAWRDSFAGEQKLNNPTIELLRGAPMFASLNSHLRRCPSRVDDLESLAYTLIFFIKFHLPWSQYEGESNAESLIFLSKSEISPAALCRSCPTALEEFISIVRKIRFGAKPNYRKLISLFGSRERGTKRARDDENDDYEQPMKRKKI